MTQLALEFTRARRDDPETSKAAARNVENFAHGHYALIAGALKLHGPGTIYELAAWTKLSHVQVARRLPEMSAIAERTGEKRPSPSGNGCGVWRLK